MEITVVNPPDLEAVVRAFGEVLDRDDMTPEHNFFSEGGNSLHAVRALSLINEEYGLNLTLADLMEAPTACSFTALVLERLATSAAHHDMEMGAI